MPQFSDDKRFNDPMKNAKGLGSVHHGADHWIMQRLTAISNIPLVIWLVYSIVNLGGASYEEFTTWLAHPLNTILMLLLLASVFYHARLGAQVITEDYVGSHYIKITKIIAQKFFFFALAVACIFSVLKIAFTAGI